MFASPVDFLPERGRNSSKRMARVYEQDPRSKSMTALQTVRENFPVSEESRRGLRSSRRPPESLSPLPPSFHSPGLSSSCSNSPIFSSPITPGTNNSDISYPTIHVANSSDLPARGYSRTLPPMPSLHVDARKNAAVRQATTASNLPTSGSFNSSLPYLTPGEPAVIRSANEAVTLSREGSYKERRRYGLDFEHELSLAHKQALDEVTSDRRRNSFLPSIHTQELEDAFMNMSASRTSSSTSLYTSEFDLEFPQPPLSPDLGAYKDCPMFTEAETRQVKNFLRNRWGANNSIDRTAPVSPAPISIRIPPSFVPSSLPVSPIGDNTGSDPSWTGYWDGQGLGDFSWEACDGSGDTNDKENESSQNILGKIGFLNDVKDSDPSPSPEQRNGVIPVLRFPNSLSSAHKPVKEGLDEVSVVLTALRSSIDLDDSGERVKSSDDDAERDKTLWKEMRMRLKPRSSLAMPQIPCKREDSIIHVSSPTIVASKNSQTTSIPSKNTVFPSPPTSAWKPLPTLHAPKSDGLGEARIASRNNHKAKHAPSVQGPRSSALDRLESSISKLQTHSPHQRQQSQACSPPVPPKDRIGALPLAATRPNLSRRSGAVRKKPAVVDPLPMQRLMSEPQIGAPIPNAQAIPMNLTDRHLHARSPSAPVSVPGPTFRSHLAPAFSIRPNALHHGSSGSNVPQPTPPPALKKSNTDGFRSFMDITPEQKPRQIHVRSRSSMAGAVFHAEKARKLLARASSSIANWGKGLARSSSRKG